jgi:hypothetical protein
MLQEFCEAMISLLVPQLERNRWFFESLWEPQGKRLHLNLYCFPFFHCVDDWPHMGKIRVYIKCRFTSMPRRISSHAF